jgi:hypothetical protein
MGARIGFALLAYNEPAQLHRLVLRLNTLYNDPPIAIHHDFGKCSIEAHTFPDNVRFVRPHISTRWSSISCFLGLREALRLLYNGPTAPDWFVFLSGSDYPTAPASQVLHQLEGEGCDAYLDHRIITWPPTPDSEATPDAPAFRGSDYVSLAHDRYRSLRFWFPAYSLRRRTPVKLHLAYLRVPSITRWFHPFSAAYPCYAGEWWFSGNASCAEALVADTPTTRKLINHLKHCFIPEECVIQTIVCNAGLKVSRRNHRFIEWQHEQIHPRNLDVDDVPRILASGAHFARKFAWPSGKPALDAIDTALDADPMCKEETEADKALNADTADRKKPSD